MANINTTAEARRVLEIAARHLHGAARAGVGAGWDSMSPQAQQSVLTGERGWCPDEEADAFLAALDAEIA